MYLKYIRESFPCGEIHRGKLYSVHFEPNEMGDYNEHLTLISEVYEIGDYPPALIFPIAIRQCDGHKRLRSGYVRLWRRPYRLLQLGEPEGQGIPVARSRRLHGAGVLRELLRVIPGAAHAARRPRRAKKDAEKADAVSGGGTCQGKTKDGEPCKRKAKSGSNFCWQHDK